MVREAGAARGVREIMRRILGVVIAVIVLVAIGAAIFAGLFVTGAGRVDDWVVRQVVTVSNTYLVPKIAFEDFNYTPPLRVDLNQVTFTAPDGTEVIAVDRLRLTLAKVPRRGEPIVIQGAEIIGGRLELVQGPEGGLKGLVPFVKRSRVQNQEQVDESVRLSNVLEIRTLALRDAGFIWKPAGEGPPMEITGLEMDLDLTPDVEEAGWYTLKTSADRAPILSLDLNGRFNIDTFVAEIKSLALDTALSEETYSTLPPPVQSLLREHDVRGALNTTTSGRIPLTNWRAGDLKAGLTLRDANMTFGEGRLPIRSATMDATLKDQKLTIEPVNIDALEGVVSADGDIDLKSAGMPARLSWTMQDVNLQEAVASRSTSEDLPRLQGVVDGSGNAQGLLTQLPGSLSGEGSLHITQGQLVNLPVFRAVAEAMKVINVLKQKKELNETVDAAFKLRGDAIDITKFELQGEVIAATGQGLIKYDGTIDARLRGGPVKRLTGALGQIGEIIGGVTQELVAYRITGPLAKPSVNVQPLGIGKRVDRSEPEPAVADAAEEDPED